MKVSKQISKHTPKESLVEFANAAENHDLTYFQALAAQRGRQKMVVQTNSNNQ